MIYSKGKYMFSLSKFLLIAIGFFTLSAGADLSLPSLYVDSNTGEVSSVEPGKWNIDSKTRGEEIVSKYRQSAPVTSTSADGFITQVLGAADVGLYSKDKSPQRLTRVSYISTHKEGFMGIDKDFNYIAKVENIEYQAGKKSSVSACSSLNKEKACVTVTANLCQRTVDQLNVQRGKLGKSPYKSWSEISQEYSFCSTFQTKLTPEVINELKGAEKTAQTNIKSTYSDLKRNLPKFQFDATSRFFTKPAPSEGFLSPLIEGCANHFPSAIVAEAQKPSSRAKKEGAR
ncbi:MAG: hypothetical protein KDD34_06510 [Bdellovibrionales bacterium]|nr:hypothetical protein [Bdellovibrionales bacterium]